jgi:hypothetical protein
MSKIFPPILTVFTISGHFHMLVPVFVSIIYFPPHPPFKTLPIIFVRVHISALQVRIGLVNVF